MTNGNDLSYPFTTGDWDNAEIRHHLGLTKREYFAAMAMQGLCVSMSSSEASAIADESIKQADELIKALNKSL
jgi:hypothetical protein